MKMIWKCNYSQPKKMYSISMSLKNHTRSVAFQLRIEHNEMINALVKKLNLTRSQVAMRAFEDLFRAEIGMPDDNDQSESVGAQTRP